MEGLQLNFYKPIGVPGLTTDRFIVFWNFSLKKNDQLLILIATDLNGIKVEGEDRKEFSYFNFSSHIFL